ncbi:MAG TPA: hypothetical protein VMM82_06240, partial [Spirochaetia bacterium]|nr:hypothetical protein [Spirochaetia bacterium]
NEGRECKPPHPRDTKAFRQKGENDRIAFLKGNALDVIRRAAVQRESLAARGGGAASTAVDNLKSFHDKRAEHL